MFTVNSQKRIARKHNVPDVVINSIFRDVETEVPGMIVERGFLKEMRESLNHLKTWFDAQELVTEDKLGDKTITALCIVKNLHNLVEALIARHKIRRPRVNNNCLSHTHLQFCVITVLHCRIVISSTDIYVGGSRLRRRESQTPCDSRRLRPRQP